MFGLIFRLLCILIGLIYPCYASYKAIKINDATLLERWLMYWVVMGLIGTLEATVEWTVAWIPFYSEVKMLVFVWLALPQIQGSTYVYLTFVHPFLLEHEREIDDTTTRAKAQARAAGMDYIKRALSAVRHGILGQDLANAATALDQTGMTRDANTREAGPQTQPQAQSNAYAINAFGNWLRQNAPAALAAGNVLLAPMQTRQVSDHTANLSASGSLVADPQPQPAHATRESLRQRRAKLEKELADLRTQSDDDEPIQHLRTAADSYEQIDKNEIPTHPVPITPTRQTSGWWSWSGSAPRQKAE